MYNLLPIVQMNKDFQNLICGERMVPPARLSPVPLISGVPPSPNYSGGTAHNWVSVGLQGFSRCMLSQDLAEAPDIEDTQAARYAYNSSTLFAIRHFLF